jgi:hypothetical protein
MQGKHDTKAGMHAAHACRHLTPTSACLCVLVDEVQRIRHIVVAQVHNRGADPATQPLLAAPQDVVDGLAHTRGRLHPVQPLACM